MSYLDTDRGKKLFDQYLKQFKGGSQRVYRSEVQQFFEFKNSVISEVKAEVLHAYQEKIAGEHTPATTKRKFSMLNGFFKYLQSQVKGFVNPIEHLKDFKTHRGAESEAVRTYLAGFIAEQNTVNTRRSYENLIRLFFTWAGKDLVEIGRADIIVYRDYLRTEKAHKDTTVWNKFIALNRFFKYVER